MKKIEHVQEFIDAVHELKRFWIAQKISEKDKLEGFAHSILCMLDGVSGSFDGSISSLEKASKNLHIHDYLYKKNIKGKNVE